MEVEVKNTEPLRVVAMRHTGPYPLIGDVFGRLAKWGGENSVPIQGALAIFYMDPNVHAPEELQSDACLIVPAGYSIESPNITMLDMPAQKCAVAKYVGPYTGLPTAWGEFMGEWFPKSGLQADPAGLSYEQYMNDMRTTPPDKLETWLFQSVL